MGFFLLAYGMLLCCYTNILMVVDYELVYNGTRVFFGHLELVEVDGSCLA